jgi:hypothetical protein
MSTDPRQERTLGQLVASATKEISTLVRGEIALAKAEVSVQFKKAGKGGGLLAGAAVIGFYSVYFLFTTLVEVLDLFLPRWAAYLTVTVLMLAMAGVLAMLGAKKMKTVDPAPKRAIAQAEQTVAALKSATEHPGSMAPAPRPEWDRSLDGAVTRPATAALPDSSHDA